MEQDFDTVRAMIEEFKKNSEILFDNITDIVYFTNGGINWEQAWCLSTEERIRITNRISKHKKHERGDTTEWM